MASIVNMQARVARRLCNSSLRYWIIEFLKRQPKERRYHALILRFIKDRVAALLLVEVSLKHELAGGKINTDHLLSYSHHFMILYFSLGPMSFQLGFDLCFIHVLCFLNRLYVGA